MNGMLRHVNGKSLRGLSKPQHGEEQRAGTGSLVWHSSPAPPGTPHSQNQRHSTINPLTDSSVFPATIIKLQKTQALAYEDIKKMLLIKHYIFSLRLFSKTDLGIKIEI